MNNLQTTLEYFGFIVVELTILFLGISTLVNIIMIYVPDEKLKSWISKRGIFGNILGALIGGMTPFCACSTIPLTLGLLKAGTPFGPVMSFVIASPILNPIILSMVAALMGLESAIIYGAVTFTAAVLFGVILDMAGLGKHVRNVRMKASCCNKPTEIPVTFNQKAAVSFRSAWSDFVKVMPFMVAGVAAGAAIYGYMPQDLVAQWAGPDNPLAIPIAAIIGIPLYIRAETAIPIGIALAQKGMSLGAVIALVIGGAGMAIPEMTMLGGIFKKRLVAAIVAVIFSTAVVAGLTFNVAI
ncbi:MAG: permease [Desulfovibrio sp.]